MRHLPFERSRECEQLFIEGYSMRSFLFFILNRGRKKASCQPTLRPRRSRLWLEALESRTLLNNRFVVPVGVPVDNVNTFATLQAALTTATVNAGDVIQIEPGSSPGNIVNADL